jgi:hypothetical protein
MVGGQLHSPAALSGTHCTGDWVGPRAGLDRCGKSFTQMNDPRAVQPVASRYTDYANPARRIAWIKKGKSR